HHDFSTAKDGEVALLGRVRYQLTGKAIELRRPRGEGTDSRSDDYPSAGHDVAVVQNNAKADCFLVDRDDGSPFHVGHGLGLEPTAVSDKALDGDWPTHNSFFRRRLECVDR